MQRKQTTDLIASGQSRGGQEIRQRSPFVFPNLSTHILILPTHPGVLRPYDQPPVHVRQQVGPIRRQLSRKIHVMLIENTGTAFVPDLNELRSTRALPRPLEPIIQNLMNTDRPIYMEEIT